MGFQRADFGPLSPNEPVDNMSSCVFSTVTASLCFECLAFSSNATHYTQPQYYPTSHVPTNINIVPPMPREDSAQKKRPKYTRSKTGCLTCRAKKIKVTSRVFASDDIIYDVFSSATRQSLPVFVVRMAKEMYFDPFYYGTLLTFCKCTWPESAPMARHSPLRKSITDDFDGRPSTAGSSGLSDTSTPPTRNHTPPNGLHMGLPPLAHRQR